MTDSNEPTAWEEINPAMALAQRQERRSPSLAPATSDHFRNELTACLALVAPAGMSEEARRDWLTVAWATLGHLPADMLSTGCKAARQKCDHPAKIVPTIIAETDQMMRWRKETANYAALPPPTKRHVMDRRGEPMSEADTAKLNEILANLGATARYRTDGSRYMVDAA